MRPLLPPCSVGLINETWFVGEPAWGVLQALHPIFGDSVHTDIHGITTHLAAKGLMTPTLISTRDGRLSHVGEDGRIWRLQTFLPGQTFERIQSEEMARSAGRLVGRWHSALNDLAHSFAFRREGVHDTAAHFRKLERCLTTHSNHRLFPQVERLANQALRAWSTWSGVLDKPLRICHGDLKISNIRFDCNGSAIALIDLDTMGYLTLDEEMGDAWRSWCNTQTEDESEGRFDVGIFEASLAGYVEESPLDRVGREGLEYAAERIALELSARFLCDALEESYFGWDQQRFATRGDHNLQRGEGQVLYALSIASQRGEILRAIERGRGTFLGGFSDFQVGRDSGRGA